MPDNNLLKNGNALSNFDRSRREVMKLLLSSIPFLAVDLALHGQGQSLLCQDGNHFGTLAGEWRFKLDAQNKGISERWFSQHLRDRIALPGSMDEAGYGYAQSREIDHGLERKPGQWDVEQFDPAQKEVPGIDPSLKGQPIYRLSRSVTSVGPAWYQREIVIPAGWMDKYISLTLERCLWQTMVWIDEVPLGQQDSLSTPHIFEAGVMEPGEHRITIRVDNSNVHHLPGGLHAYGEDVQTIWNGIIGEISLRAHDRVWIKEVQVFPDQDRSLACVITRRGNAAAVHSTGRLSISSSSFPETFAKKSSIFTVAGAETTIESVLELNQPVTLWDEFSPALCDLSVSLEAEKSQDEKTVTFGIRKIAVQGSQFTLNGRTIFLRGTHDGGAFPLTGYPDTNIETWRRIFRVVQSYGLDHVRYHSWCPPEAAFAAADESGVLLQVELPAGWAKVGKDGIPDRDAFWRSELDRILDAYGNHPSFCLFSMGNEFHGEDERPLVEWVEHARAKDPRHLYTTISNPEALRRYLPVEADQYMVAHPARINGIRITRRMEGGFDHEAPQTDADYRETLEGISIPVVSHEVGQ